MGCYCNKYLKLWNSLWNWVMGANWKVLRCMLDKSRLLEEIYSRNMDSKGAPGEASYGIALLETGRKAILL